MSYVRVRDNVRTEVTRSGDPDDRWDRDDTYESHNIRGIEVVGERDYHDLVVDFEVDPTRPYFLLYGIYSTGDSFGHDEGRIEFVDLYASLDEARKNLKRLEEHNATFNKLNDRWSTPSKEEKRALNKLRKTFSSCSVELKTESGKEYDFHVPWHGYFERLTTVEIEPVLVR